MGFYMKTIFEQTDIGGLTIKNRIIRSATQEGSADQNGNLTPALLSIYENLAAGGVGAIITAMIGVDEYSRVFPQMLKAYGDAFVPAFSELVNRVHKHNCKIIVQLAHNGAKANPDNGERPLAPSDFSINRANPARSMTKKDIQNLTHRFTEAAMKCKEAKADGVQIHAAHGYLLSQFLSPVFNKREDEYGGDISNRARIVFEIYSAIRGAVGDEYPVFIKINSEDRVAGGLTLEESMWVCSKLEKWGINGIEVSGGLAVSLDSAPAQRVMNAEDEGTFAKNALAIAGNANVPIVSVGGYRTPEIIEALLNKGNIQAVSLCRPLISEPDLPNRWKTGDRKKARCISCNKCFDTKDGFGCKVY